MKGKKHKPEQIIKKLREADVMLAASKTIGQVTQALEIPVCELDFLGSGRIPKPSSRRNITEPIRDLIKSYYHRKFSTPKGCLIAVRYLTAGAYRSCEQIYQRVRRLKSWLSFA